MGHRVDAPEPPGATAEPPRLDMYVTRMHTHTITTSASRTPPESGRARPRGPTERAAAASVAAVATPGTRGVELPPPAGSATRAGVPESAQTATVSSSHGRDGAHGARVGGLAAAAHLRDISKARPRRLPIGGAGGQRPRRKHQLPAAHTVRKRLAADSTPPGHAAEACMQASQSMHGGWGRRAPLWLHRRHRGGAFEALRRCLVDKFMPQVLVERRWRRRPSWWAHSTPFQESGQIWTCGFEGRPIEAGTETWGRLGHARTQAWRLLQQASKCGRRTAVSKPQ